MFTEGIFPIGDGLLDIDEERLKGLLVPHDINEIYDVEQTPFARGKFAAVRRAVHKNSGVHFAAKFLKRRRRAQSSDKEIKHEIAVLMLCEGEENIVKLNAVHESRSDTALLLELATGGELQALLDNDVCLSEAQARICMREVLKALQFLHKRSIAHLDLKPQNILLTGERVEDGLKLCDFGISRVVAEGTNVREILGTPDYVAPEVLQYEPLSLLTDIWSVGVLAYVLLSGFSPFGGDTKQETFLNISQCALTFPDKMFGGVSGAAIDFIRRALRIKPNDRMTAAGCLEHTWLTDECAMGRQLCNNVSKRMTSDEYDLDDDDDEDEDEEQDISIEDEYEEEDAISTDSNSGTNGYKMDSSDVEPESMRNGCNGNAAKSSITTTAILTVPAARATTIPLRNMQQQIQLVRRHSSDSNKENTYLTTKKIIPATATNGGVAGKQPSCCSTTATATIMIAPNELATTNVVATITLPNGGGKSCSDKSATATNNPAQCLFPDAPTTPKVIRKAPTTESPPTSVKALVKKFQRENGNAQQHLREAQATNQQQQMHAGVLSHSFGGRKSTPAALATTTATNGIKMAEKFGNGRRASEPLTAVHKKSCPTASTASTALPTSTPAPAVASYKSTCVFGLNCEERNGDDDVDDVDSTDNANGCGHPAAGNDDKSSCNGDDNSMGSATKLLLNNHHHHHHHYPHHHAHHHHHHHAAKNGANNLSLDQGIIC